MRPRRQSLSNESESSGWSGISVRFSIFLHTRFLTMQKWCTKIYSCLCICVVWTWYECELNATHELHSIYGTDTHVNTCVTFLAHYERIPARQQLGSTLHSRTLRTWHEEKKTRSTDYFLLLLLRVFTLLVFAYVHTAVFILGVPTRRHSYEPRPLDWLFKETLLYIEFGTSWKLLPGVNLDCSLFQDSRTTPSAVALLHKCRRGEKIEIPK